MTCDDFRQALTRGTPLGRDALEHAGACDGCALLLADDGRLASILDTRSDMTAPADFFDSVANSVSRETGVRGRLRGLPTRTRLTVAAVGAVGLAGAAAMLQMRPDIAVYPLGRMTLVIAVLGVLLALALHHALRPMHEPGAPESGDRARVALLIVACFALAGLPSAHLDHPASLGGVGEDLVSRAFGCFSSGTAIAAPLFVLLRLLDRGAHVALWPMMWAAAALGVLANVALQFHCPITHPAHLLLGHAGIALAAVLLALPAWRLSTK
jgi:hypothetical protein